MALTEDSGDRFGIPESAFKVARNAHRSAGTFRVGMYVPARHDVATLPASRLRRIIIDWMWESPTELIPTSAQIAELLAELEARHDAIYLETLIAECRRYIEENGG